MRPARLVVVAAVIVALVALSLVPSATVLVAVPSETRSGEIEFEGMALQTRRVELEREFPSGSADARRARGEVVFSFSGDNILQSIDWERARVPRGTTVGRCADRDGDGCLEGVVLFETTAEAVFDRERQDCFGLICRAVSPPVPISAVAPGVEGNVEEGAIAYVSLTHVDGRRLSVTNPYPIIGGTEEGSLSAESLRSLEHSVEAELRIDLRRRSLVIAKERGYDDVVIGLRAKTTTDAIADRSTGPFMIRTVATPVIVAYSREVMLSEAADRLGAGPRAIGRDLIPSTLRAEPVDPDPIGYLPGRSGPVRVSPRPGADFRLIAKARVHTTNVDLHGLRSAVARQGDTAARATLADRNAELVAIDRSPSWWPIVFWARRVNMEARPL